MANGAKTLYQRLGGYDVIAAVIDDFYALQRADASLARFAMGRSQDSRQRSRQLLVDQLCHLAGGPCVYIGRDMKTAHAGLGITETEWDANIEHTVAALRKNGVGEREQAEFLELFTRYKSDIVGS